MKKILAFAGSNSSKSINQQLVVATSEMIDFAKVDVISLRDYNVHIFGVDIEAEQGSPEQMQALMNLIKSYDGYIISTPEHNGIPPAFFLNILDWLSRIERRIFGEKPTFLLSTSTGPRAGSAALQILENVIPRFGADVSGVYAFPSFNHNFQDGAIQNHDELEKLKIQLQFFESKILEEGVK